MWRPLISSKSSVWRDLTTFTSLRVLHSFCLPDTDDDACDACKTLNEVKVVNLVAVTTLEQSAIDVCCSTSNLCGYGQGHCDDSTECIHGLVCKHCDRKTYLIGTKCCMLPYIPENTIGADKLFLGQGHCTYDWECYGSLICGTGGKKDCTDQSVSNETNCCKQGMYLILRLYILV